MLQRLRRRWWLLGYCNVIYHFCQMPNNERVINYKLGSAAAEGSGVEQ